MSRNKLTFRKVKNRIEAINSFFPFPVFCFVDFAMCIIELGAKDSGLLKLHGQTKKYHQRKKFYSIWTQIALFHILSMHFIPLRKVL